MIGVIYIYIYRPKLWCKFLYYVHKRCTNPGCQVAVATKLCKVMSNACWSSVRNLLLLTLLTPRIMRRLLDFWKTCTLLMYINYKCDRGAHHTCRGPADWHEYNGSGRGRSPNRSRVSTLICTVENVQRTNEFRSQTWSREPYRIVASFVVKYLMTTTFVSLLNWVNISWRLLVSKTYKIASLKCLRFCRICR